MSEQTAGYLRVESAQRMQEILELADGVLVCYGNPPLSIEATFKDGDGNTYRGMLYLVRDEQKAGES